MRARKPEHQYWEDRSETYDEDSSFIVGPSVTDDIVGWLGNQFAGTDSVLELACGTGTFSEAVAPLVSDLTATDMSEPMLRRAGAKLAGHGNVRFLQQDAYRTTFDDEAFDVVFMANLLHIVHEPDLILRECARVVRAGGKVVVVDLTSQGTPILTGIRLGWRYLRRWGRPPASNRTLKLGDLIRLIQEAGFVVQEEALVGATVKAACVTGSKPAAGR